MTYSTIKEPKAIALIGPYQSGKTSLLEKILYTTSDSLQKRRNGTKIFGDNSPEAREQSMGIELNVATTEFMGSRFYFLDCPGSLEYLQETINVLPHVDAAVLVLEPNIDRVSGLAPLMHLLDQHDLPHLIFINKIDRATGSIQDLVSALNDISDHPVVLRHLPIRTDDKITGYVDLASERAYVYEKGKASHSIAYPKEDPRVEAARYGLLESLADFDDHLMEELLEDIPPPKAEIFDDLAQDTGANKVVSALIGSALGGNGVFRLLKALRHEVPGIAATRERRAIRDDTDFLAQAAKTFHTDHGGKRTLARVFSGTIKDGDTLGDERISGILALTGDKVIKQDQASAGDFLSFGRLGGIQTGDSLSVNGTEALDRPDILPPVYEITLDLENRNDDVRLAGSITKLCDEDPSLSFEQREDVHELVLRGQGDVHLKTAVKRLKSIYNLDISHRTPQIPYQETIRRGTTQHARYRKQSGGHGQYGDVVVEIRPLGRGEGFDFEEKIHGGSIPRQYISSVETGVKQSLTKGPLGFPVVDIGVKLTDGKYHAVDSSDMAFQLAGRLAMSEALPDCQPVLLEPIMKVHIMAPNAYTNKVAGLISQRRGQILDFELREGWPGWDRVSSLIPKANMHDLIIELRSMTSGSGTYVCQIDHMQELTGKLATRVLATKSKA